MCFLPSQSLNQFKILVLALSLAVLPMGSALGEIASEDPLSAYEQSIFFTHFSNESTEQRLTRLEKNVFGATQTGDNATRQQRLAKVMGQYHTSPHTVSPNTSSSLSTQALPTPAQQAQPQPHYAQPQTAAKPDATDYPTVTALEHEVFGRDFIYDPLPKRLSKLEKKVYGQEYEAMALVDRLDQLLMRYPHVKADTAVDDRTPANSALRNLPGQSSQFVGSGTDTYTKIELLEQSVFGGQTYPQKLLTERLDSLEQKVLGYTKSGMSVDTRVNALLVARSKAQTAQARPPIQPRPTNVMPPGNGAYYTMEDAQRQSAQQNSGFRNQNIQIGAGMSSTTTGMQYSPELIQMLPNDLRQQIYTQQQSGYSTPSSEYRSSSSTTIMAPPGTVITEEITRYPQYPGIQTFPNGTQTYTPPIQYKSYYSIPGNMGPQTINPQITPPSVMSNGVQVVTPQAPVYTGNPMVIQQLAELEAKIFGQVDAVNSVPARLIKLEATMTGRAYTNYSDEDRVNNLIKVYQYQTFGKILGDNKAGGAGSAVLGIPLNTPPQP